MPMCCGGGSIVFVSHSGALLHDSLAWVLRAAAAWNSQAAGGPYRCQRWRCSPALAVAGGAEVAHVRAPYAPGRPRRKRGDGPVLCRGQISSPTRRSTSRLCPSRFVGLRVGFGLLRMSVRGWKGFDAIAFVLLIGCVP